MKMNVVDKINGIFANVMKNNQERCSDHLLEIINELLHMASDIKKKEQSLANEVDMAQMIYDSFLVNFSNFMQLLGASDVAIVEKAASNILSFIHFSMIQGINKNENLTIKEQQL